MAQSWQLDKTECHRTDRPGQWTSHGSGGVRGGARGRREKGRERRDGGEAARVHKYDEYLARFIHTYICLQKTEMLVHM